MRRGLAALAVAGLFATTGVVMTTTNAAFTDATASGGSSFGAGTVTLTDNDAGTLLLDTTAMRPGDSKTTCVQVSAAGSLPATVRLHGTVAGDLGTSLTLLVERGAGASALGDCSGFSTTATVFDGTVAGFASAHPSWDSGAGEYTVEPGGAAWFRVRWTLQDSNAAQGKTAAATYTWEGRSGTTTSNFRSSTAAATVTVPADQMHPPTGLGATHQCLLGVRRIRVTWTASPTSWATDYRVYRSVNGGAWEARGTVAYGTNSWDDGSVSGSTDYAYQVRTERSGWTWVSPNSDSSNTVTTPSLCL